MKEDKNILNNLKRTKKSSVPNGFFDSFADDLFSEIEGEYLLESLPKNTKPKVPQGFFDDFSTEITAKVQPKKQTKIIQIKMFISVASVAAVLAIMVLTNPTKNTTQIADGPIENPTEDDNFDEYLAYLDESTLVDYIIENDINIEGETTINESVYSELENELDDYYYGY